MESPNISKLIVGFLLVAVVVSSSLLLASIYRGGSNASPQSQTASVSGAARPFVENLSGGSTDPDVAALLAQSQQNTTADLAETIAKEIADKNPSGPTDKNGQMVINPPTDINKLVAAYIQNHPVSPEIIKSNVADKDILIANDATQAAVSDYISNINKIILNLGDSETATDPETGLTQSRDSAHKIVSQLRAVSVPKPLADFHKALIAPFQSAYNFTTLATNDPASAAALSDTYETQVNQSLKDLDAQVVGLQKVSLINSQERNLIQIALGVQVAHAQWVDWSALIQRVTIAVKTWALDQIKEYKKYLLEWFKRVLLRQITEQLMSWIAGNGKPQFITNWNTFLGSATNQAIGSTLGSINPALCSGIGVNAVAGLGNMANLINAVFQPSGYVGSGYFPACTLGQVVQNVKDFQNDFRNGGWLAYSAISQPQNTFFGAIIEVSDKTTLAAAKAEQEAQNKALAGQGFTGQELCDDGHPPMTKAEADAANAADGEHEQAGQCFDGSTPHIATPGVFSKDLSTQGFNNAYNSLVTIGDYKALAAYAADMALSNFLKKGVKGLLGYLQKKDGGSYTTSGGGYTAPAPETPSTDPAILAGQILERKKSSLTDAQAAASAIQDAINTLQQISQTCTANSQVTADAAAQIQALQPLLDDLSLKIQDLKPQVTALEGYVNNPTGTLPVSFGTLSQAQTEAENMADRRAQAEGVFTQAGNLFASCSADVINTPLPQVPPTHLACVNNICGTVSGEGENTGGCSNVGDTCTP